MLSKRPKTKDKEKKTSPLVFFSEPHPTLRADEGSFGDRSGEKSSAERKALRADEGGEKKFAAEKLFAIRRRKAKRF